MSSRKPTYETAGRLKGFTEKLFARSRPWPLQEAAAEMEVHPRTIRNWVSALAKIYTLEGEPAVRLVTEGRRRFVTVASQALGMSRRSTDLASLTLAERALGTAGSDELATGLRRIAEALCVTPDEEGRFLADERVAGDYGRKFALFPWGAYKPPRKDVLDEVLKGLLLHERLSILPRGEKTEQRVEPLTLAVYKTGLVLLYRPAGSKEADHLLVSFVERARALGSGEIFRYPSQWDPQAYRGKRFGLTAGKPMTVRLRFAPHLYEYLTERVFHPSQRTNRTPKGEVRLTMEVEHSIDLVAWICAFGDEVRVVGPVDLRKEVAGRLRRAAEQYG